MLKGKTVVLGVTGSIAAYKIANLASMLVKLHCNVHVIMTQNATNFINPITFAEAGATINTSAFFARETCSTLNWKLRSKVSTRHLLFVKVSNVIGLIKLVAFCVIITCTSA